jgi:hypothetical protein
MSKTNILSQSGEILSESALEELKSSVQGEVIFKGVAEEEVYAKAIDRYNKATIKEAVSVFF